MNGASDVKFLEMSQRNILKLVSSFYWRFRCSAADFADRFPDFGRISTTLRLVFAFPHLVETETAQLNLQMELVELKK